MSETKKCPKCGYTSDTGFADCPSCGVIISKFLEIEKKQKEYEKRESSEINSSMGTLANAEALKIQQQKEWGEILSGFETRNKYTIMDSWGNQIFVAEEESGSIATVLTRFLLNHLRPFTIRILSQEGNELFVLKRPFRFFFHELDICESNGMIVGKVIRRFSIFRRIYAVIDRNGREIYQLFGPILRPWTFLIKKDDQELGKIVKKWSGLAKETFTDADNFGINFPKGLDADQKAIFLGAVFLIDFVHFEKKQN
jgi:uncharacterized protein YxjI